MRKISIFALFFIVVFSISGCKVPIKPYTGNSSEPPPIKIEEPDETVSYKKSDTSTNVSSNNSGVFKKSNDNNNYSKNSTSSVDKKNEGKTVKFDGVYIGSKSTKKFHKSICRYAPKIKEKNRIVSKDRSRFISEGYSCCKQCEP